MLIDSTVMSHLWKQITQFFRHLVNFNARAGHSAGRYFFCHKSPAARARELFKPSTDFGSLLVSVEKKKLVSLGFSVGHVYKTSRVFRGLEQLSSSVLPNRVNGSPQGEWDFCKGEWKNRGEWRVNQFSVAKFLHPLIVAFLPNTYQQSWTKWRTSNVLS